MLYDDEELDNFPYYVGNAVSACTSMEHAILKSHLCIEFLFNKFLFYLNSQSTFSHNFSFADKAKIFQLLRPDSRVIELIFRLNKIRNNISHKLRPKFEEIPPFIDELFIICKERDFPLVRSVDQIKDLAGGMWIFSGVLMVEIVGYFQKLDWDKEFASRYFETKDKCS